MFDGSLIEHLVLKPLPASIVGDNGERATLVYNQILNLAAGHLESEQIDPQLLAAVAHLGQLRTTNTWAMASTGLCVGMFSALLVWLRIAPQLKARAQVEVIFRWALLVCASLAVLTTVGIILSVLFESIRFLTTYPCSVFIRPGWSPQMAIRADQTGSSGSFGRRAFIFRHPADRRPRPIGGRADGFDVGHLPIRIRQPSHPQYC